MAKRIALSSVPKIVPPLLPGFDWTAITARAALAALLVELCSMPLSLCPDPQTAHTLQDMLSPRRFAKTQSHKGRSLYSSTAPWSAQPARLPFLPPHWLAVFWKKCDAVRPW
jgi:hypothetical protein